MNAIARLLAAAGIGFAAALAAAPPAADAQGDAGMKRWKQGTGWAGSGGRKTRSAR